MSDLDLIRKVAAEVRQSIITIPTGNRLHLLGATGHRGSASSLIGRMLDGMKLHAMQTEGAA